MVASFAALEVAFAGLCGAFAGLATSGVGDRGEVVLRSLSTAPVVFVPVKCWLVDDSWIARFGDSVFFTSTVVFVSEKTCWFLDDG